MRFGIEARNDTYINVLSGTSFAIEKVASFTNSRPYHVDGVSVR